MSNASWSALGRRRWLTGLLAMAVVLLTGLPQLLGPLLAEPGRRGTPTDPLPVSSEALARRSPYSQPGAYPLDRRPSPLLYRPHAAWMGRLILPTPAETASRGGDWVWVELEQTPAGQQQLRGRRLRLTWAEHPELQALVAAVTTDIHLGASARQAAAAANVVPTRLDGRKAVGPLQSLAGARPVDDLTVQLEEVSLEGDTLRIGRPPVQTSGRWMALATVVAAVPTPDDPDRVLVRHFDPASGGFDGPEERIRIPRLPPDRFGRLMLDPTGLAGSPLNAQGWLLYGSPTADGVFTVQAIQPRALLSLTPQRVVRGTSAALAVINRETWSAATLRRGSLQSIAVLPDSVDPPASGSRPPGAPEGPPLAAVGQRALLVHSFGGIGGADGEPTPGWTVTGHFAFGEARVVRDPFSGDPRLDLRYHQIYANNPNGIVAGSQDWSAYAGNLQRGWVGTRPIADVLVPLDGPLLDVLAVQSEILSARYRSGDGTGVALVTPATSCVQDSSQALWIALDLLRRQGSLAADQPPGERSRRERLGEALNSLLTPFGMVRQDWRHNAGVTASAGTGRQEGAASATFQTSQRAQDVLLSWRSMLPRRAHDGMATVFVRGGLPIWILRTNQIPGKDDTLAPLAPTSLLGQLPVVGTLLQRLGDALFPPILGPPLSWSLLVLGLYAAVALPLGFRSGFLQGPWRWGPWRLTLRRAAGLLLMPALVEELVFRVLLLPHPLEGVGGGAMAAWGALSVGLFVAYHPLAARFWYPQGWAVFHDPRFLLQCTLLGSACVLEYVLSGSLWSAVLLHWLAVVIWLEPLQGRRCLGSGRERVSWRP
ncbi:MULTISPECIES: CPBP family glutamic-type intramembrane protease [Aphanothece]|uniref:CPBP family glutamic-type intramembrane protease n=1 Tax=Aphanothece TaxID=1121 RepID=UPI0039846920